MSAFSAEQQANLLAELDHYWDLPATIEDFLLKPEYLGLDGDISRGAYEFLAQAYGDQRYNYGVLSCGFGWGKSFAVACALAYMVHRTACLKDPQAYYQLAPGSEIAFINFSVTYENAKKVLFGEVLARIDNCPWFQQGRVKRNMRRASEVEFPGLNMWIFPAGSDNTKALGHNMLGGCIDEAAWLPEITDSVRKAGLVDSGGGYDAAETIFTAMSQRVLSRGNARWKRDSMIMMLSQPRYPHDFLQRKLKEREWNTHLLGVEAPTWEGRQAEFLSGETFEDPVCGPVPVEFQEAFQRNEKAARRDLGGRATEGAGNYFPDKAALARTQDQGLRNCFHGMEVPADVRFTDGWARYVHVDLGATRDACGIAVFHVEHGGIVGDGLTRITAKEHFPDTGEIDFEAVRELILSLQDRGCYIAKITYDGWQSRESIQQAKKAGVAAEKLSVDKGTEVYDTLKENLPRIRMPFFPWFVNEAGELDLQKANKIDHPARGSKDVSDAVAGAVYGAVTNSDLVGATLHDLYKAMTDPAAANPDEQLIHHETGEPAPRKEITVKDGVPLPEGVETPFGLDNVGPDVASIYPWAKKKKRQGFAEQAQGLGSGQAPPTRAPRPPERVD